MKHLLSALLLIFLFTPSLFSQSNDHIYATIKEIPHEVSAGQTFNFEIIIENKSKDIPWSKENLKYEVSSPFTIMSLIKNDAVLAPGQSETIQFSIIAPVEVGTHKLTVDFYNDNIKLAQKTREIKVISADLNTVNDKEKGKEKKQKKEKKKKKDKKKDKNIKDKDINKDEPIDNGKDKYKK
jgi:hypothetical protein